MLCPPPEARRIFCLCGCGNPTNIIKRNHFKRNRLKGQFAPYLPGHQNKGLKHPETTGENHWTYGKQRSLESRKKQGDSIRGKNHWNWRGGLSANRGKLGIPAGERHWNWKGGVTSQNHKERTSPESNAWRKSVYARDNYTCKSCGNRGGKLHAHHIKSWAEYPELRFELNNGRTLCRKCHYKEHGWRLKS